MQKKCLHHFLLIFLSCLLSFETFSQTDFRFADSTATWHVLVTQYYFYPPSYTEETWEYGVSGDTMVSGKSYQIIGAGLVRKDSLQRVYYLDNFGEQLLFDFNLEVGDTFRSSSGWQSSPFLKVDSVDFINLGTTKKRMFLSCVAGNCYLDEVWVDGIGNLVSTFYGPFSRRLLIDGPTYELLCYSEQDTTRYHNPNYNTCYYDTIVYLSVQNISLEDLKIFPNPTSETINVSLPNIHSLQAISVTNRSGKPILQTTQTEISVSHLAKGLYFVKVEFTNGESVIKKIIIQ